MMRKSNIAAAAACIALAAAAAPSPRGNYTIAVESETAKDAGWAKVVEHLRVKYDANVVEYSKDRLAGILPALKEKKPRYVCFVARPEAAGRALIVEAAQLLRKIDDDPWGDAIWGVVTGYDATSALRNVSVEPFTVRRIATSMGNPNLLDSWDCGFATDEGNPGRMWKKKPGGKTEEIKTDPDPAIELARAFRTIPVDYWVTSGHATESNWQIIYNRNKGFFVQTQGILLAVPSGGGKGEPVISRSPKVYIAAGNCLIGHVKGKECMALAWMRSGGAVQMLGYTVSTFYGYMGWTAKSLFESGRASAPEAHFLANQMLLWTLGRRNTPLRDAPVDPHAPFDTGRKLRRSLPPMVRDMDDVGLIWDRDTFSCMGDPAMGAKFPASRRDIDISQSGDAITLKFRRNASFAKLDNVKSAKPVGLFLDREPPAGAVLMDASGNPVKDAVVCDMFALIPLEGEFKKGETLTFKIGRAPAQR